MSLKPLRTSQPATKGGPPLDGELYRWLAALLDEASGKPRLTCLTAVLLASELTDGGASEGTKALPVSIPAGARFLYATAVGLVGFVGDVTAVLRLGDGADLDRYNTGTPSIFTTASSGVDLGAPSGTAWHSDAVVNVIATVNSNSNITPVLSGGGSVALQFWFLEPA